MGSSHGLDDFLLYSTLFAFTNWVDGRLLLSLDLSQIEYQELLACMALQCGHLLPQEPYQEQISSRQISSRQSGLTIYQSVYLLYAFYELLQ